MEELKKLRASRRAHRSHLKKTLTSVTEVLEKDSSELLTDLQAITLTTTLEGLQRRKEILTNLDRKTVLIEQEELETDIYECEEIQTNIVEKIAQLQFLLRFQTTRPSKPISPAVTDVPTTSIPPVIPRPTNTSSQSVTEQGDLTHIDDTPQQPPTDSTAITPPQNPVSGYNVSRLPKLNIPMFTGDPLM